MRRSLKNVLAICGLGGVLTLSGQAWSSEDKMRPHGSKDDSSPAKTTAAAKNRVPAGTTNAADNTGVNKRDRKESEVTADQQKNGQTDLALTADIRKAIVEDDALSTSAHNVKIIARGGSVTLKGPVATASEKKTVEDKAKAIAGAGKVVSQIEIAP